MIDYIIRLVLCSAFFIAIYFVFLQNERMHRFNRFYLLFAALSSVLIPTLNFNTSSAIVVKVEQIVSGSTQYVNTAVNTFDAQIPSIFSIGNIVLALYGLVALVMILRFVFFNLLLIKKTKNCDSVSLKDATIVLSNQTSSPYSYFSYIFVPKSEFENHEVDKRIIDHERAHVIQKHSIDILFMELLIAVVWFNPVFYLFRNSIRLNHEFLADESVISIHGNTTQYQHLLVSETAHSNGLMLKGAMTCPFNYLRTKKRLEMMTKMKITQRIIMKQFSLIPLFFVTIILFSNNSIAQEVKAVVVQAETLLAQNQTTAEDELQKEFDEILSNYIKEKNGKQVYSGIDGDGQKQLIPLFEKMSETQKSEQIVRYWPGLKKRNPSKEEFESWKNPSQFGVWLNNKRISNEELNKLNYSDIAYYDKSRLAKNAKNYGKHVYQLNALTNSNFEEYNYRLKTEPYLVFWPKERK